MRAIVFIILLGLITSCVAQNNRAFTEVDTKEMMRLVQEENVVALDVRTPGEVAAGYITGTTLFIDYNNPNFSKEVAKLDKKKKYVVYCRSGNRSTKALNIMNDLGFKKLYELDAGIKGVTNSELIKK